VRKSRIHAEACVLEHALSDEVEECLARHMKRTGRCRKK
jgi:Mn-dependent DtxR family transcriptional regulator